MTQRSKRLGEAMYRPAYADRAPFKRIAACQQRKKTAARASLSGAGGGESNVS